MKLIRPIVAAMLIALCARANAGVTDTAFTYQGRLQTSGLPAGGSFAIDVKLWNAAGGGSQVGATLSFPSVAVSDGLFTLELDFGAAAFDNSNRWLEIIVDGTPLAPRQPITRAPYAIATRGLSVGANGNVGIGTGASSARLHVQNGSVASPSLILTSLIVERSNDNILSMLTPANRLSGIAFGRPGSTLAELQHGAIIYNEPGSLANTMQFRTAGNLTRMVIDENGRVGIGVTNPQVPLQVVGEARFEDQTLFLDRTFAIGDLHVNGLEDGAFIVGSSNQGMKMDVNTIQTMNFVQFEGTHIPTTLEINPSGGTVEVGNPPFGLNGSLTVGGGGIGANRVDIGDVDDNGELIVNFSTLRVQPGDNGFVGVNTSAPTFQLHVNGTAGKPGGGSWSVASDIRLKKNIEALSGSLDQLLALRGVSFEYVDPESIQELDGRRIGMIAQEVEAVFPDWIERSADGYRTVTYRGFEALSVEALRELRAEKDAQIEALRTEKDAQLAALHAMKDAEMAVLRNELAELRALVAQLAANKE